MWSATTTTESERWVAMEGGENDGFVRRLRARDPPRDSNRIIVDPHLSFAERHVRMKFMRAAPLLLGLLVVVGCSSSASTNDPPASAGSSSSGGGRTPEKGAPDPTPSPDPLEGPACTGAPGSIYEIEVKQLGTGDRVPMCRFEKKVLLIVNTASFCGSTPQLGPLEELYKKYEPQGFVVLGFPSASFDQEASNESEVTKLCTEKYGLTFPMFAIGNVNAPNQQPLYTWLKSQPGQSADIGWNFEKFLIGRDGKVAGRFLTAVEPDSAEVTTAIEAALKK